MNNSQNKKQGFLYAAMGKKCLSEFLLSLKTLKEQMPDSSVSLVTDVDIDLEGVHVIKLEPPKFGSGSMRGFIYKTLAVKLSPYKKTVFLDCDTYILKPLFFMFDLVESFDICAALSPYDSVWPKLGNKKLFGFTPVNSGVLCFSDQPKSSEIINKWSEVLISKVKSSSVRKGEGDQTSLNEAILLNKGGLCVLPNNFNLRIFNGKNRKLAPAVVEGEVYIVHTHKKIECHLSDINSTKKIRAIYIKQGRPVMIVY